VRVPIYCRTLVAVDWLQFAASVVGAIAWPLTVLVAVLAFRKQLTALLGERLKRLKLGPVEGEWGAELNEVEDAITKERLLSDDAHSGAVGHDQNEPSSPSRGQGQRGESSPASNGSPESPRPGGGDLAQDLLSLRQVAEVSPQAAVLSGFIMLERTLLDVTRALKPEIAKDERPTQLVLVLAEQGIFPPRVSFAVKQLRELRNRVAHGERTVTVDEARGYLRTLENTIRLLGSPLFEFEAKIALALRRIGSGAVRLEHGGGDFAIVKHGQKYFIETRLGRLSIGGLDRLVGRAQRLHATGLLVVASESLAPAVEARGPAIPIKGLKVEVATWRGPEDDAALTQAVERLVDGGHTRPDVRT
jgi:hypothetical protein